MAIGLAMIVAALLMGCQAECVRECRRTMEACFESSRSKDEREQCMNSNTACVKACASSGTGTRFHWEIRDQTDEIPAPKLEKPSAPVKPEGFEEDEGFE